MIIDCIFLTVFLTDLFFAVLKMPYYFSETEDATKANLFKLWNKATPSINQFIMCEKLGSQQWNQAIMTNWHPGQFKGSKSLKLSWSCLGAASKIALPIQPICLTFAMNGLNWQGCLAVSSKMAPRFFYFLNCHGCRLNTH